MGFKGLGLSIDERKSRNGLGKILVANTEGGRWEKEGGTEKTVGGDK